jgi:hypothetical protein
MGYSLEQLGFSLFTFIFLILSIYKIVAKCIVNKKTDQINNLLRRFSMNNDQYIYSIEKDKNTEEIIRSESSRSFQSLIKYTNRFNSFQKKLILKLQKEVHYLLPSSGGDSGLKTSKMVLNYFSTFNNRLVSFKKYRNTSKTKIK